MKKTSTPKKAASDIPAAKSVKPKASKVAASVLSIDKACEVALDKLKELNLDTGLQSEIQWCLGSYQHDGNPAGLYIMAKRAVAAFTVEKANKTKGITAKLISDIEKAIGKN